MHENKLDEWFMRFMDKYGVCFILGASLSILFIIFLCLILPYTTGIDSTYSEGIIVGQITNVEKKGCIVKGWEGEILIGGVGYKGSPHKLNFSIIDEAILPKLQSLMHSGARVEFRYRQVMIRNGWRANWDFYAVDAAPMELEGKQ